MPTLLLVPSSSALYSHQQRSAESNDNSILVAPTGSGKTESALLWLNRQKYNLAGAGRFFYVLPYQASLNAMYLRLAKIIPGNVTLQHSRSLQALFKLLLDKGYSPIQASIVAKQERSLAKLHHFGVRVLTPYQLLRAAFQLKGFEALITDCAGAHIVFDEIHAYETKRLGMILGLIEYLRENWQCRFFIMSATLPSLLSKHLAAALEHYVDIRADKQIFQQFVRHKLHIISSLVESSTVISQIMESANNGEAVLVVCNTVKKASAVFQELHRKADGLPIKVSLLHSRFNARDRLRKERELMTSMGTIIRERKDNEGMILVATQVVEVSLDIDFDRLFSEVAPMESLVQRFGRINRGRKHATCPVHILTEPGTGQHVYDDRIIERVLQLLPELDGQIIDESMISAWLDRIYEGSLVMEMEAELLSSKQEFMAVCINELVALDTSEDLNDRFDKMFDGTEVLPAQFLDEFEQLSQQDTLLAGDMFVPISYRQLSQLKRSGKIEQRQYLNIAHVPYSSEHGLEL